jgi:hypothetical protein
MSLFWQREEDQQDTWFDVIEISTNFFFKRKFD